MSDVIRWSVDQVNKAVCSLGHLIYNRQVFHSLTNPVNQLFLTLDVGDPVKQVPDSTNSVITGLSSVRTSLAGSHGSK